MWVQRGRHSHLSLPALELSRAPYRTISWSRAPSPPPHPVSASLIGRHMFGRRARTNERGALLRQAVGRRSSFVQRLSSPGVCVWLGAGRGSPNNQLLCSKIYPRNGFEISFNGAMFVKAQPLQLGENLKLVGCEGKPVLVDTLDCLLHSERWFQYCRNSILWNIYQVQLPRLNVDVQSQSCNTLHVLIVQ